MGVTIGGGSGGSGGSGGGSGSGIRMQTFHVTVSGSLFTVTDFTANDNYLPIIDEVIQSKALVTRSGNNFTCGYPLQVGQVLTIIN